MKKVCFWNTFKAEFSHLNINHNMYHKFQKTTGYGSILNFIQIYSKIHEKMSIEIAA